MWKDDAPVLYVVITVLSFGSFCAALVISLRRQPHRLQRVRRFLCCVKAPLARYTSVPEAESELARFVEPEGGDDRFVIGEEEDEVEIDLEITPKSVRTESPVAMEAATV